MNKEYLVIGDDVRRIDNKVISLGSWFRGQSLDVDTSPAALADKFLQSTWAQRCIGIRANMLASIPWEVRDYGRDGSFETLPSDDLLVKLITDVNEDDNYLDLMRATGSDLLIYGAAYWRLIPVDYQSGDRVIKFIQRMNPLTVKVKASKEGVTSFVQTLGTENTEVDKDEVIYFHTYHPKSDVTGLSSIEVCIDAIDTIKHANTFTAKFFENGAVPALIVSITSQDEMTQPAPAEIKKFAAKWRQKVRGPKNAGKTLFVKHNVKVTPVSLAMDKVALKEVKLEARREICAAIGVPMSMAGASEAANRATSQEQRKSLYVENVFPQGDYIAGVINAGLVKHIDPAFLFIFLNDEMPFMQEAKDDKCTRVTKLVEAGIITADEGAIELGYERKQLTQKTDLELYRMKALRRVKANKSLDFVFESDEIDKATKEAIQVGLKIATNSVEVRKVFTIAHMSQVANGKSRN